MTSELTIKRQQILNQLYPILVRMNHHWAVCPQSYPGDHQRFTMTRHGLVEMQVTCHLRGISLFIAIPVRYFVCYVLILNVSFVALSFPVYIIQTKDISLKQIFDLYKNLNLNGFYVAIGKLASDSNFLRTRPFLQCLPVLATLLIGCLLCVYVFQLSLSSIFRDSTASTKVRDHRKNLYSRHSYREMEKREQSPSQVIRERAAAVVSDSLLNIRCRREEIGNERVPNLNNVAIEG